MKNTTETIKAAPTARGGTNLDGMRNILTDALYEMGYDDTLVDILIERNVIDFSTVDYTSHIIYQLEEHYGESVSWGGLEDAVALEGLAASLTGELGKNWRAAEGDTFRERIRHIITDPIENLGMKLMSRYELENNSTFSEELEDVKQHLAIAAREKKKIEEEATVFELYTKHTKTQSEIAKATGLSQSKVSRILNSAKF